MGLTNCKLVMTEYLYSQNPFYELRLPISLICGILVYRTYDKKIKNTLLKIIFPLVVVVAVFSLIHYMTPMFIDQRNLQNLIQACESWKKKNEPIIIPQDVVQYAANQPNVREGMNSVDEVGGVEYAMPSNLEPEIEQFSLFGNDASAPIPTAQRVQMNLPVPADSLNQPIVNSPRVQDSNQYDLASDPLATYQRPMNVPSMGTPRPSQCLLGSDPCSPLCSGDGQNPCNIVSPIPGPAWQPRTAAAVQNSLAKGQFTAASCLA